MIRDKRKSKEYFDQFIAEDTERIEKRIEKIENGFFKENRVHLAYEKLFELELGILIAKYSRGDEVKSLLQDFKILAEYWNRICSLEWIEIAYEESLWFISMGLLLREREQMKVVEQKLKETGIDDWLFNLLLSDKVSDLGQIEGELLVPEKYQTLKQAITASDKQLMIQYLEKEWYGHLKDYGWYDSHKLTRKSQSIYFGYWCFEVAAVMKKLNWSDSELLEQPYYPYEFVHFQ